MADTQTPAAAASTKRTVEEIEAELATIDDSSLTRLQDEVLNSEKPDPDPAVKAAAEGPVHDYTYEARRKGWRPKEEFEGPQSQWVDAETFILRGEKFVRRLQDEITSLRTKVESFEGTKEQFRKFFTEQMAKRDREHTEAITELRLQKSQATRDGDDDLVVELEDRIDATKAAQKDLKKEAEEVAKEKLAEPATTTTDVPSGANNPVLLEWMADGNSWFQTDEVLTKYAVAIGNSFRQAGDKTIGREFLDKITKQVRADFPRKFKELDAAAAGHNGSARHSTTEGAGQSSTGHSSQSGHNGKTERDLPEADLAIMRQFVKEGLYTKESFLKSYFSRNG